MSFSFFTKIQGNPKLALNFLEPAYDVYTFRVFLFFFFLFTWSPLGAELLQPPLSNHMFIGQRTNRIIDILACCLCSPLA